MADQIPPHKKFLHVPYDERWQHLKDVIVEKFMHQNLTLPKLAESMRLEYSFDAQPQQYRYRLKTWGIRKRITTDEKEALIKRQAKRTRDEASTSDIVIHQGGVQKELTTSRKKQFKRYIDGTMRNLQHQVLTSGFLTQWNLPHPALHSALRLPVNQPSPATNTISSMEIVVNSPPNPVSPHSPFTGPSPTTQAIRRRDHSIRAGLFLQGRNLEVLQNLSVDDRNNVVTWCHDLWMFSFMTAKYWGRGPKQWTPGLIKLRSLQEFHAPAASPAALPSPSAAAVLDEDNSLPRPSQLCRWSIHYSNDLPYEPAPSPPRSPNQEQDIEDETTWTAWDDHGESNLDDAIQNAISENHFSHIHPDTLPIDVNLITQTAHRSTNELRAESFAFAIMARNVSHIRNYTPQRLLDIDDEIAAHHPFHLAASYLDGADACCLVMNELLGLECRASIGASFLDPLGHTVLDSLFINILRSHTNIQPGLVHDEFRTVGRFPGEEVDLCGRWDADSPCLRKLYASGTGTIPISWKHAFCHTSVQAICHSITVILSHPSSPDTNTHSGMFVRICNKCRQPLKLRPLHSLVIVAFLLANNGMRGETLFGAIACLVCLLAHGANPRLYSDLSVSLLLKEDEHIEDLGECIHNIVTPLQLALDLDASHHKEWSNESRVGWSVFVELLRFATSEPRPRGSQPEQQELGSVIFCSRSHIHFGEDWDEPSANMYCLSRGLGQVWAAIQAEFTTYRRINVEDTWISGNFDVTSLHEGLRVSNDPSRIRLLEKKMVQKFSACGWFYVAGPCTDEVALIPTATEMSAFYFMNMEDWKRTKFIGKPIGSRSYCKDVPDDPDMGCNDHSSGDDGSDD